MILSMNFSILLYEQRAAMGLLWYGPPPYKIQDRLQGFVALMDHAGSVAALLLVLLCRCPDCQGVYITLGPDYTSAHPVDTAAKFGKCEMWECRIATAREGLASHLLRAIAALFSPAFIKIAARLHRLYRD